MEKPTLLKVIARIERNRAILAKRDAMRARSQVYARQCGRVSRFTIA